MATVPVRSQPLHNFSLSFLKWGKNQMNNQRCRKPADSSQDDHRSSASEADSDGGSGSGSGSLCEKESELEQQHRKKKKKKNNNNNKNNNNLITPRSVKSRVKSSSYCSSDTPMKTPTPTLTMSESETGAEEEAAKSSFFIRLHTGGDGKDESVEKSKTPLSVAAAAAASDGGEREAEESAAKPWNLRPRRVAFKASVEIEGATRNGDLMHDKSENQPKSLRLRGIVDGQNVEKKKEEKRKFWISLSRDEIEEDFFLMTGSKPSRRPKKRAKNIQKQLDNLFPGLWLAGITADSYIVPDVPAKLRTLRDRDIDENVRSNNMVVYNCQAVTVVREVFDTSDRQIVASLQIGYHGLA